MALVECKEGGTCQPAKLDGKYDRPVSVFWMLKFFVSQHERCRLQVTITAEPAGQQGEHKVTLVSACAVGNQYWNNLNRVQRICSLVP